MSENTKGRNKRGFWLCCLMFVLFYMSHGSYYPYIGLYYNEIGLDNRQIGIVSALGPCLAMLVQTFWGRFADRSGRRRVLALTLLLSAGSMLLFYLNRSFGYTLLIAGLYVVCSTSSQPLTDTIALDYCSASGFRFAPIRLCGTIGFGVMPLLVGGLMNRSITNIFPLYAAFCVLAAAASQFVPGAQGEGERNKDKPRGAGKGAVRGMLRDPAILFVLLLNLVVNVCLSTTSFLPVYAAGMGMSNQKAGLLNSVSAACEVPIFLCIDRILRRFRREHVMLATLFFTGLRMMFAYLAGLFPQQGFLLLGLSQALHSVSYIMLYYCSAQFIHGRVRPEARATAQTLVAMVASGLAKAVGSVAVGALGDALGLQNAYLCAAGFVALSVLPVCLLYRKVKGGAEEGAALKG